MFEKKRLPIGEEFFGDMKRENFYYVDKTKFIQDLLENHGMVNLFTRPRRFGKSLNMNMLKVFFEVGSDASLFDGMYIRDKKELCEEYMGKFPVISITLKGVDALKFETANAVMKNLIGTEAERFYFLTESSMLTEHEKEQYRAMTELKNGIYSMSDELLFTSLKNLSGLLYKHYGKKVILLIDEYDVPLDKAFQAGFYDEMVSLVRNLLGNALKTNDYLEFAVLTGCLRISKESIFTGLNNLKVHTITDNRYDEYFGFTESEVKELLAYYHLEDRLEIVKKWYNGYKFGSVSVYCPWDVINYCDAVLADQEKKPENYWANTSGNGMIRRFIDKANRQTRNEMEQLVAGEAITKELNMELTYNELDSNIENLWSVLFTTGYLTMQGKAEGKRVSLVIPNMEIRELFISQIQVWFKETTRADVPKIAAFCDTFPKGDVTLMEEMLNDYLWNTISIRDTAVRRERKENFYHGMLLGLLQYEDDWYIKSNVESGEGYGDILIETGDRTGIVIEIKYARNDNLEKGCREALKQIEERQYDAGLVEDGMKRIVKYGIAFYKKRCKVLKE